MNEVTEPAQRLRQLALSVARCAQVPQAREDGTHPCRKIVTLQSADPDEWQVPEGWAGNLAEAKILFLSSNPSISEAADYDNPLHAEDYPRGSWSDDAITHFATNRFGEGEGYPATIDGRLRRRDGQLSDRRVVFWLNVRKRAQELIEGARPDQHYAMTEVVHCKSTQEIGVAEAVPRCASTHLDAIIKASHARLLVVLGAKARDRISPLWNLPSGFGTKASTGDENTNLAVRNVGGTDRLIAYLWHPTGMTAPKTFAKAYPEQLQTLVDLVNERIDIAGVKQLLRT